VSYHHRPRVRYVRHHPYTPLSKSAETYIKQNRFTKGKFVSYEWLIFYASTTLSFILVMLRSMTHERDDVEWRGADCERPDAPNGSLPQESFNEQRKRDKSRFCAPQLFGGGIYLPDPSTYDPIEILINTEDRNDRNRLTEKWRDNKLSELNFVGVVVRLGDSVLWLFH
jgi:hypothetical protein